MRQNNRWHKLHLSKMRRPLLLHMRLLRQMEVPKMWRKTNIRKQERERWRSHSEPRKLPHFRKTQITNLASIPEQGCKLHVRTIAAILMWLVVVLLILNNYFFRSGWVLLMVIATIIIAFLVYFSPQLRKRHMSKERNSNAVSVARDVCA